MTIGYKQCGFTLLELIVVIIIIGVLASMAYPKYITMIERARAVEAIQILSYLRDAQIQNNELYGDFVPPVSGNRRISLTNLVVPGFESEFYGEPIVENYHPNGHHPVASIWRNDLSFHLHITEAGLITCAGRFSSRDITICPQLGFQTPFF